MHALPTIKSLLITLVAVFIVLVLIALLLWHLRTAEMRRVLTSTVPRPDVAALALTLPVRPVLPLLKEVTLLDDVVAWYGRRPYLGRLGEPGMDWPPGRQVPANVRTDIAAVAPALSDLRSFLARGADPGHVIQALRAHYPTSMYPDIENLWCSTAWGCMREARMVKDPTPDLDALDALAMAPRAWPYQQWFWVQSFRDRAYLMTTLAGTLPMGRGSSWQTDPDRIATCWLLMLDTWRCTFSPNMYQCIDETPFDAMRSEGLMSWWRWPAHVRDDVARQERCEVDLLAHNHWTQAEAEAEIPSMDTLYFPLIHFHRLAVLTTQIIARRRSDGTYPVPLEVADLDLAAGGDRMALVYALRDGGHGFVIAMANQQPPFITACLHAKRLTAKTIAELQQGPIYLGATGIALSDKPVQFRGYWNSGMTGSGPTNLTGRAGEQSTPASGRSETSISRWSYASGDGFRRYRIVAGEKGWRVTRSIKTGDSVSLRNQRAGSLREAADQLGHQVIEDLQAIYSLALVRVRTARDRAMRGHRPGFRQSSADLDRQFAEAMRVFAACCREIAIEWEQMLAHARVLTDGRAPEVVLPVWLQEILDDLQDERSSQMPTTSDPNVTAETPRRSESHQTSADAFENDRNAQGQTSSIASRLLGDTNAH